MQEMWSGSKHVSLHLQVGEAPALFVQHTRVPGVLMFVRALVRMWYNVHIIPPSAWDVEGIFCCCCCCSIGPPRVQRAPKWMSQGF